MRKISQQKKIYIKNANPKIQEIKIAKYRFRIKVAKRANIYVYMYVYANASLLY